MRQSLKDLTNKTIIKKYTLPNLALGIEKSIYTTDNDHCFSINDLDQFAQIIYNSVVEYAHGAYAIKNNSIENLHAIALKRKLKFNPDLDESKSMQFGFFGETILYIILRLYFKSNPLISKGYFYDPLENSETKGFDSFHLVEESDKIELWFGEAKFFQSYSSALDSVLKVIETNLSDQYLERNLYSIQNQKMNFENTTTRLGSILEELDLNPEVRIVDLLKKNDIKFIYPILIIADELNVGYDESINSAIEHIKTKHSGKIFSLGIEYTILFIYIPIECTKRVKLKVIEWIKSKERLMS